MGLHIYHSERGESVCFHFYTILKMAIFQPSSKLCKKYYILYQFCFSSIVKLNHTFSFLWFLLNAFGSRGIFILYIFVTYRDNGMVLSIVVHLYILPNLKHLDDTNHQFFDSVMIPQYWLYHVLDTPANIHKTKRINKYEKYFAA